MVVERLQKKKLPTLKCEISVKRCPNKTELTVRGGLNFFFSVLPRKGQSFLFSKLHKFHWFIEMLTHQSSTHILKETVEEWTTFSTREASRLVWVQLISMAGDPERKPNRITLNFMVLVKGIAWQGRESTDLWSAMNFISGPIDIGGVRSLAWALFVSLITCKLEW